MSPLSLLPLENALTQLEKGFDRSSQVPEDELLRDGVIQRYEYCIDLSWKLLQKYLKQVAQVSEFEIRTKKDLFREGAKKGLISSAERWIEYFEARNETSHTYIEIAARDIYRQVASFLGDLRQFLEQLKTVI